MKINSQIKKGQLEITVELSELEFNPYLLEGARRIAAEVKIPGFRNGKAPYNLVKARVGEMTILEEAARVAVNRTIDEAIKDSATQKRTVGQPNVNITKLAPGNPLEYKVTITLLPSVKLTEYTGLNIKQAELKIDQKQIDRTLEQLQEANVLKTANPESAKLGNLIIADINISVDKVPIEGGQGQGVNIILGKDYLVPGFDKELIGAKTGQELKFKIKYPKNHYQKTLADKMVDFKVKINEIWHRELPKLDDQLAQKFGFQKFNELVNNIKESLTIEQLRQHDQETETQLFDKLIKKAEIEEIPEMLINQETEIMLDELQHNLEQNGGNLNDYLSSLKKTKEQFVLEILPQAIRRIKAALIIGEIAQLEKIQVANEEVDQELAILKQQYQNDQEILERLNSPNYRNHLASAIVNNKTIRFLKDKNLVAPTSTENKPKTKSITAKTASKKPVSDQKSSSTTKNKSTVNKKSTSKTKEKSVK